MAKGSETTETDFYDGLVPEGAPKGCQAHILFDALTNTIKWPEDENGKPDALAGAEAARQVARLMNGTACATCEVLDECMTIMTARASGEFPPKKGSFVAQLFAAADEERPTAP